MSDEQYQKEPDWGMQIGGAFGFDENGNPQSIDPSEFIPTFSPPEDITLHDGDTIDIAFVGMAHPQHIPPPQGRTAYDAMYGQDERDERPPMIAPGSTTASILSVLSVPGVFLASALVLFLIGACVWIIANYAMGGPAPF